MKIHYLIYLLSILWLPSGCVAADLNNNSQKVYESLCLAEGKYTESRIDEFIIRLFDPNDELKPDIWQGPICISNSKTGKKCGFELSLIKSINVTKDKKRLKIGVFSGSNAMDYFVDLETCELTQK